MEKIADLLFEAKILKNLPRSGYQFLGTGKESVAEHSFMITFISFVMAQIEPDADELKLMQMCLLHDLPEARTGDLNYVQKKYVTPDEKKAIEDTTSGLLFGEKIKSLIEEFNEAKTKEARLAKDADQISFILELKNLYDTGSKGPERWIPIVYKRLLTKTGEKIATAILNTPWDKWWRKNYVDGNP